MYANENMLFSDIVKTFNNYHPLKSEDEESFFYFELKPIKLDSQIKEIELRNMFIIEIIPKILNNKNKLENTPKNKLEETPGNIPEDNNDNNIFLNIIFLTPYKDITVQSTKYTKFREVVKKFFIKIGNLNINPIFISNSKRIDPDEGKTLEKLDLRNQSKINVAFAHELLGA